MRKLNEKILKALEYPKVVDRLVEHAATSLGKERSAALRPSTLLDEVRRQLSRTGEAADVLRLKGDAPFGGIRDIRRSLARARIGGMLSAEELLDVAQTISGTRKLKSFLASVHEEHSLPELHGLYTGLADAKPLEEAIRRCIDDHGAVIDSASPELARIRRDIRTAESQVRERLESLVRSSSAQKMLQEQLITIRNDRYVIPVKQEYRAQFGGLVHDQSASGATLFIEPEAVVQLNNRLRELRLAEEREVEKILRALSARTAERAEELASAQELLAELDFIFAKASLAREWKCSPPAVNDQGRIRLRKARHPLIASDRVVPVDVELGYAYTAIIITGPNTGGKTVTLKTIGLLHLMAMSGLFVPAAEESELCVFDGIYADIGDEQSIEQSLSTFSGHLTNIIRILREMTPNSLVLLDELGAGTDPAEGSALAIALLEHIHRKGCRVVATTHYSELKAYAYEREGVINASMEFDVQTLSPTYRLMVGVPGRSNAFAIAERLGLPREIIEQAQARVGAADRKVDHMIASLEENRIAAEEERLSAEKVRAEAEALRASLAEERRRFEEQKDRLLEKARQEARQMVERARREADAVIAELRQLAMQEQASIKEHKLIEAKRRLEEALPAAKPAAAPRKRSQGRPAEPGDEVIVGGFGKKGIVLDVSGDEATVQIGIMKMKVPRNQLEVTEPPRSETPAFHASASVTRTRDDAARMEIDVRGSSLDDALVAIDRFLDDAVMANLGRVYIIHGKGTGVLRSGIQEYLRKHRLVSAFRSGNYGEGGSGVTVAELN